MLEALIDCNCAFNNIILLITARVFIELGLQRLNYHLRMILEVTRKATIFGFRIPAIFLPAKCCCRHYLLELFYGETISNTVQLAVHAIQQ